MKKILLVITMSILCQVVAYGQAFKGLGIESETDYSVRRSRDRSITFSTYSGAKDYIECSFVDNGGTYYFQLFLNGYIYDCQAGRGGAYFVGEETGYLMFPVYVRWNNNIEKVYYLDFNKRSDGLPVFKYVSSGGWSIFHPILN